MPSNCFKCKNTIKRGQDSQNSTINCIKCKEIFHLACANIEGSERSKLVIQNWLCEVCLNGAASSDFSFALEKISSDMQSLMKQQEKYAEKISSISKALTGLQNLGKTVEINKKNIENCNNEVAKLSKTVDRLETKLRERNIVITGVPETNGENCVQVVSKIGEIINYPANTSLFDKVVRFKAVNSSVKPILVIFRSSQDREFFLSAYKMYKTDKRKIITAIDIGFDCADKIHVGEHYTLSQHKLLIKARNELQKTGMYKFVWMQSGTVLAREDNGTQIHKIRCDADIVCLITTKKS